ncbi:MAG: hypothetical protein LM576_08280 [Thermofilum sp.]|nr:hypothetical protein [Thermofilum sp.]
MPGLFIFFLRAAAWLYGRFKGVGLVTFWIYRYSRHPPVPRLPAVELWSPNAHLHPRLPHGRLGGGI